MRLRIWLLGLVPLLAVALVAGFLVLRDRGGAVAADAPAAPIVLVSGYGGRSAGVDRLAGSLASTGRRVAVLPPVGDNTGDLREQAAALDSLARSLLAGGRGGVDVVGFSAGGVVARIWADGAGRDLVRRVVTLGSPHHGTDLAALAAGGVAACPAACRQLAPGSDLLDRLPDPPGGPRWTSIWTAHDDVVVPPDSAVLRGVLDIRVQDVCPDDPVRHTGLPDDPLVVGLVRAALTGPGLTAVPPPSRCRPLSSP